MRIDLNAVNSIRARVTKLRYAKIEIAARTAQTGKTDGELCVRDSPLRLLRGSLQSPQQTVSRSEGTAAARIASTTRVETALKTEAHRMSSKLNILQRRPRKSGQT